MVLDAVTKKLEVLLGGAVTTNQLPFQCDWMDVTATSSTPGTIGNLTNGATPVDLVAVPAANTQRIVNAINIYNADTVAAVVTVRYNDNGTLRTLAKISLQTLEMLTWSLAEGWRIYDVNGNIKYVVFVGGRQVRAMQLLLSGTTYVVPAGCNAIQVEAFGAGGGGGGATFSTPNMGFAGGGASGSYARRYFTTTPGTSITYGLGVAGTAGANTGTNGGTGGDTTITVNGILMTAKGGIGGVGTVAGATSLIALGGAGVSPTNGEYGTPGSPGGNGIRIAGTVGVSGNGGGNWLIPGAQGSNVQGAGAAGGVTAGGAGAAAVSASVAGGVGGQGVLAITEFYSY